MTGTPSRSGRTSTWAVAALLCSIGCPVASAPAILFGVRGLAEINANPQLRGRSFAWSGIVIGALGLLLTIVATVWWNKHARQPMIHGPAYQLRAGLTGDVESFRAGFVDQNMSPEQARHFLDELRQRYGQLSWTEQSHSAAAGDVAPVPGEFRVRYTLHFQSKNVDAEAVFVTFAPGGFIRKPIFLWRSIHVFDSELGDVAYPPSAAMNTAAP